MRKELDYYKIDDFEGGNQNWFNDYWMKIGGCGAITACDTCIFFDRKFNQNILCPINPSFITKDDFINFGMHMKPYLSPRITGIDKLDTFISEFQVYLDEKGENKFKMVPFHGDNDVEAAKEVIKKQIDNDLLIPYLNLKHQDKSLEDYEWHWFVLAGYEEKSDAFFVKAMSYGKSVWFDFENLWNTGNKKKGGMVLYTL